MFEFIVAFVALIVTAVIGFFTFALFWTYVCAVQALVGMLYPTKSRAIRRSQLATLVFLILGLICEASGLAAFLVWQVSWKVALPVFVLGLVLMTIARVIASFIERECLESNVDFSADPKSAQEAQALPWKGQA